MKNESSLMKKIVALLTICSPFFLNAQGFQVNLQGQKQQGMGGTVQLICKMDLHYSLIQVVFRF